MKTMKCYFYTIIGLLTALRAVYCAGAESSDKIVRMQLNKAGIEFHNLREAGDGVYVDLSDTNIADLRALSGMPITGLNLSDCHYVTNLTPLAEMPLAFLNIIGTSVTDLSPLQGMPLCNFFFSPETSTNNVSAVRQSTRCITINQKSPVSFWNEYDSLPVSRLRQRGLGYESVYVTTNGLWNLSFWKQDIRDLSLLKGCPLPA